MPSTALCKQQKAYSSKRPAFLINHGGHQRPEIPVSRLGKRQSKVTKEVAAAVTLFLSIFVFVFRNITEHLCAKMRVKKVSVSLKEVKSFCFPCGIGWLRLSGGRSHVARYITRAHLLCYIFHVSHRKRKLFSKLFFSFLIN